MGQGLGIGSTVQEQIEESVIRESWPPPLHFTIGSGKLPKSRGNQSVSILICALH
jgi:hypothetical protein